MVELVERALVRVGGVEIPAGAFASASSALSPLRPITHGLEGLSAA